MRSRSSDGGLTQHHVDLPSMVCLVIEQMTACDVCRLDVVFALVIRVSERPAPKRGIKSSEERLNPRVLPLPRAAQGWKNHRTESGLEEGSRRFRTVPSTFDHSGECDSTVHECCRKTPRVAFGTRHQLPAFRKKPLVRRAVIPRQHLEMSY
jgi:hypothetical protein